MSGRESINLINQLYKHKLANNTTFIFIYKKQILNLSESIQVINLVNFN